MEPYSPPTVEIYRYGTETGFANSDNTENVGVINLNGEKVNIFFWSDASQTKPTNANERMDPIWGADDNAFWGGVE